MRTKDQMYDDIRNWEMEAGEDFLDYFGSSLNGFNFLFWCLGKGYITESQLHYYEKNNDFDSEFLYGTEKYSIIKETEEYDEGLKKAYRILAEFFSSSVTYQRRVDLFLKDISAIKFEDALKYYKRDKVFFEIDERKHI